MGAKRAGQGLPLRMWLGVAIVYLIMPLILLAGSGDWGWGQAWAYGGLVCAVGLGGRWLAERRHPGLMRERTGFRGAAGVKPWDKLLSPLMALSVGFPLVIVAALDHRYAWTPALPGWLSLVGLVLIAGGYALAGWALVENRFFSSVVRIQSERGHTVCDTGPYRYLRHPGYAGNILALPGVALALGSLWTLLPAAAALVIALARTALEDRALQAELPGYRDYARRVRWRVLPGIF